MDRFRIAIVIPAYNEAATVAGVIEAVKKIGRVFVVDDASTDETAYLAEKSGATVIRQSVNRGYDAALSEGFRAANNADVSAVITMDADGQHLVSDVRAVADSLVAGHHLVLGVRSGTARLAEKVFAALLRCRWGVKDPLCGLKGYHIDLYRAVGFFDRRESTGTELMIHALNTKYKPYQLEIQVTSRVSGTPRFGNSIKANRRIVLSMIRVLPLILGANR